MYKNQLQELAQRSCFNLPWYTCIREGPDHAPRFKATVNFNGEVFESPNFFTTLRQAEHSAAEVALTSLSHRGPSHSLAARILDETGVFKNLLQEVSQRVGAALPHYTTTRSGLGHLPVFTCTVELAGVIFTGEPAKNKKQAEKNAAMAAWSSLKQLAKKDASSSAETETSDEQEQVTIARALLNYRLKEKMAAANSPGAPSPFPKVFPMQPQRPSSQTPQITTSKILPLIRQKPVPHNRPMATVQSDIPQPLRFPSPELHGMRSQKFPAIDATPYVPIRHFRAPYHGVAPQVTIRTAVPVFSAAPPPTGRPQMTASSSVRIAPPVQIKQATPVFSAPSVKGAEPAAVRIPQVGKVAAEGEAIRGLTPVASPQAYVEEPSGIQISRASKVAAAEREAITDLLPVASPHACLEPDAVQISQAAKVVAEMEAIGGVLPGTSPQPCVEEPPAFRVHSPPKSTTHIEEIENKTANDLQELAISDLVVSSLTESSVSSLALGEKPSLHIQESGEEIVNDVPLHGVKNLKI